MRSFVALLLALSACSPQPKPPVLTAEESRMKRDACEFKAGALTADTLPPATIPIENFVLVMQENRSFDHYFSKLTHGDVRVAPDNVTNPDSAGNPIARFHLDTYCVRDPAHGWNPSHRENNGGKN